VSIRKLLGVFNRSGDRVKPAVMLLCVLLSTVLRYSKVFILSAEHKLHLGGVTFVG
jgi:hypothetical protein